MTNHTRRLTAGLVILTALIGTSSPAIAHKERTVVPEPDYVSDGPRVRSSHSSLAAVVREASERSATFRGLLRTIEATDGIVYVHHGTCPSHALGCLLHMIDVSGDHRILHIVVDISAPEDRLAGTVGHELQHAIEVLSNRAIKTESALFLYYSRNGISRRRAFETDGAVKAGNSVLIEVRRSQRTTLSP